MQSNTGPLKEIQEMKERSEGGKKWEEMTLKLTPYLDNFIYYQNLFYYQFL